MTTTRSRPPRIPALAERLRLPLWQRGQARMRERYGFGLDAADAIDRIRSLMAESPDQADLHVLLASALATRGDVAAAETEVRRAIELAPDLARAHTTLATLLVQRGDIEAGLSEARTAAAIDIDDAAVLFNLGLAEWFAGERRTARAAFAHAAQMLDPAASGTGAGGRPRLRWRRIFHRG